MDLKPRQDREIILRNVPRGMKEEVVSNMIKTFGEIEFTEVVHPEDGNGMSCARIIFKRKKDAINCAKNGLLISNIFGRDLRNRILIETKKDLDLPKRKHNEEKRERKWLERAETLISPKEPPPTFEEKLKKVHLLKLDIKVLQSNQTSAKPKNQNYDDLVQLLTTILDLYLDEEKAAAYDKLYDGVKKAALFYESCESMIKNVEDDKDLKETYEKTLNLSAIAYQKKSVEYLKIVNFNEMDKFDLDCLKVKAKMVIPMPYMNTPQNLKQELINILDKISGQELEIDYVCKNLSKAMQDIAFMLLSDKEDVKIPKIDELIDKAISKLLECKTKLEINHDKIPFNKHDEAKVVLILEAILKINTKQMVEYQNLYHDTKALSAKHGLLFNVENPEIEENNNNVNIDNAEDDRLSDVIYPGENDFY